jgi:hypothetical protein
LLAVLTMLAFGAGLASDAAAAANPPKKKPPKRKVVKWLRYDAGLAEAKAKTKPVVLVFADKRFRGPATFEGDALFKVLADSGAIPVRVSPPVLRVPKRADAERKKKLQEQFNADQKKYTELATKYAVNAMPMMIFLSPEGEVMCRLVRPTAQNVQTYVASADKILERFKAAKAAAGGEKPPEAPKPEEKKGADPAKGGAAR